MLICPVCKEMLEKKDKVYVCINKHSFDIAKQGYCNLFLKSSQNSGDNKEMVQARNLFLNKGYYAPLVEALYKLIGSVKHDVIVDAGCGEGYYTNLLQKKLGTPITGFDLSKDTIKLASKANAKNDYFISSIFDLPIASQSVDVLLNIFAPFAQEEYARLLKQEGILIKVDPNAFHLMELKQCLYEQVYENEVFDIETTQLQLIKHEEVTFTMHLKQPDIIQLLKMTPYYYRSKQEAIQRVCALETLECKASFIIYVYACK